MLQQLPPQDIVGVLLDPNNAASVGMLTSVVIEFFKRHEISIGRTDLLGWLNKNTARYWSLILAVAYNVGFRFQGSWDEGGTLTIPPGADVVQMVLTLVYQFGWQEGTYRLLLKPGLTKPKPPEEKPVIVAG